MTHQVRTLARRAIWVLPVWAVLLLFGTLTHQPDPQTAFGDFAAYVTTNSHPKGFHSQLECELLSQEIVNELS